MIGKIISHYKITDKIGSGGMGMVFKAIDLKLNRPVALKFLPPSFSLEEQNKTRFIQEARLASSLEHPNICTIYEIGETVEKVDNMGNQIFIVMSYCEGETLKKQKIEKERFDFNTASDIILQIAEGLNKAHSKGIIHRGY